jgi:Ni/Fe-hydrogenase 1 B-type cytochrome subunit
MYAINTYKRIYIWEAPVRASHWVNAISIVTLAVTGIIISDPPVIMSGTEATNHYWFGITRFIHFTAGYLLTFGIIYRMIWSLLGNKWSDWRAFFPYDKKGLKNLRHVLKIDIFLGSSEKYDFNAICVGHNSLGAISYFLFFLLIWTQIFTGFGLYLDNSTWWFPKLFAWVVPLLGGDAAARLVHQIVMWLMIIFAVVHIYLVMYHDWLEARGEASSMIGGFKYIREERVQEEEVEDA